MERMLRKTNYKGVDATVCLDIKIRREGEGVTIEPAATRSNITPLSTNLRIAKGRRGYQWQNDKGTDMVKHTNELPQCRRKTVRNARDIHKQDRNGKDDGKSCRISLRVLTLRIIRQAFPCDEREGG